MAPNGRPLYTEARVRALIQSLRADYHARSFQTMVELRRLQVEVAELRDLMAQMRAARLAVANAEAEVAHQRAVFAAWNAERDPAAPLQ